MDWASRRRLAKLETENAAYEKKRATKIEEPKPVERTIPIRLDYDYVGKDRNPQSGVPCIVI
jgi:hypothetical protein